jgi:quercetin dioxygenase-like cupin family protein
VFVKSLYAITLLALLSATALAQDPLKVEPKHYRLAFENEHVQVIEVHYGPHEKSAMHEHSGGVGVSLTEAHLRFTDENGKVREIYSHMGEARWYPPFKHRVENLGDTDYRAVYVGIKNLNGSASLKSPEEMSAQDKQEAMAIATAFAASLNQKP